MAKKYSKRSTNKDYDLDLTKYDFGSYLNPTGAQGVAQMGSQAAQVYGQATSKSTGMLQGGMRGGLVGAGIGLVSDIISMRDKKEAEKQAKYQQQVAQSIQADQDYKSQLKNQQANIPTFNSGGRLRLYPEGGRVTTNNVAVADTSRIPLIYPNVPDLLSSHRDRLASVKNINDPSLYKDLTPEEMSGMFTVLKEPTSGKTNAYTQRLLDNYNKLNPRGGVYYESDTIKAPDKLKSVFEGSPRFKELQKYYEGEGTLNSDVQSRATGSGTFGVKANGGYIIDYKGASHANGGIPVDGETGNPTFVYGGKPDAEVEGKEVATKFPGEQTPYIFSHKLGFANKARAIEKKYSKRPNEKMSQDAMYMELGGLMQKQEAVRDKLNLLKNKSYFQNGGVLEGTYEVDNITQEEIEHLKNLGYKVKFHNRRD